jgi:MoaA/NifB/PqqE/SkfB family radical SAM enzyme
MEEAGKGDPSSEKIPPGPDLLVWLCTSRCNLNCRHCYVNYRFQGELNTEEALNFIEEVARLRPNFFSITGGEPLLRKDLFQILEKARGLIWRAI